MLMNILRHRLLSFVTALLLICLILASVLLLRQKLSAPQDKVMIRQVALATPPPPPPPPPLSQSQTQDNSASIDLSVDGVGPALAFEKVELQQTPELEQIQPPVDSAFTSDLLQQLNVDWSAFGLSELDERPKLLTSLKVNFPKTLARKGITQVEVELDVLIDENGAVILRRIIHNQHPEMTSVIEQLVQKARFTAPKKDGMAVRASFTWPLEFANS